MGNRSPIPDPIQLARPRPWQVWPSAAVALALLTVVLLAPLSTHPGTSLYDAVAAGGLDSARADVRLTAWILSWGAHALGSGNVVDIFDANIFYPASNSLASSENLLGAQLLFAPIDWLSSGPALSLNLFTMLTFVLSGLAAWWVAFRWFGSHLAGAVAAVVFAFAPWRIHALVHVQLLSVMYLPLIAWASFESASRRTVGLFLLLASCCFLQAASSLYLGYIGFVAAGAIGAASLLRPGRLGWRLAFLGSALGIAVILVLPLALPYTHSVAGGQLFGRATLNTLNSLVYLYPPSLNAEVPGWGLWRGLPVLALLGAFVGIRGQHRMLVCCLLFVALVSAWLSAGPLGSWFGIPVGKLHGWLALVVPGWSSLRGFARFAILAWLALTFLVALLFARTAEAEAGRSTFRLGGRAVHLQHVQRAFAVLLIAGLALSTWRIPTWVEPAPEAGPLLAPYTWLARHGMGDPVLHVPRNSLSGDAEYMYLGTTDFSPMLNGYGGYPPKLTRAVEPLIRALPSEPAVRALEALGLARWIVVHTDRLPPGKAAEWNSVPGATLRDRGPSHAIYEMATFDESLVDALLGVPGATALGLPLTALRIPDFEAGVRAPFRRLRGSPGRPLSVSVELENRSRVTWPGLAAEQPLLVALQLEVRAAADDAPISRGVGRLPFDLEPGMIAPVKVRLRAPLEPGPYTLVPCLVQWATKTRKCLERDSLSLEVATPEPRAEPVDQDGDPTVR